MEDQIVIKETVVERTHPAAIYHLENEVILGLLGEGEEAAEAQNAERFLTALARLKGLKQHYGIKEELFLPGVKQRIADGCGNPGFSPEEVWEEDASNYRAVSALLRHAPDFSAEDFTGFFRIADGIRKEIRREEEELLPFALNYFTEEEWADIHRDLPDMGLRFTDGTGGGAPGKKNPFGGSLTPEQMLAILKNIPADMTFIDADDIVRFYTNEGNTFSRVQSSIGRHVYECHPPKKIPVVRKMIEGFKSGDREHADIWFERGDTKIRVRYQAVRSESGEYLGTMELVQEFGADPKASR